MKVICFIYLFFIITNVLGATTSTPLRDAARKADYIEVEKLISSGADPNGLDKYGNSALSGAAGNCVGESSKIIRLLFLSGAELNHQTPQGLTPIGFASSMGCLNNVKTLLELGADPKIPANNGWTPLIQAVVNENTSLIKLLLDAGVDITHKSKKGFDALFYAEKIKNPEIIDLLQRYSPLVNDKTKEVYDLSIVREREEKKRPQKTMEESVKTNPAASAQVFDISSLENTLNFESFFISFLITWCIILFPPILMRLSQREPQTKTFSIFASVILFFINIVLFTALGSQSKSHFATMIGAFVCYKILTFRYKKTTESTFADETKVIEQKVNMQTEPKIQKEISKTKKIWIVSSLAWLVWVCFRTFDDYELFGFYLSDWDSDSFFLNLLTIPILIAVSLWSYTWITKSPDSSNKDEST